MKATQDVSLEELADAVDVSLEEINIFLEGSTTLNASSIDAIVEYLGVQLDVSESFKPVYDPNLPGCVLGIDLPLQWDALSRYTYEKGPDRMGYSISCFPLTARGAPAQAGTDIVNTKTFYYSDNSHSGLPKVDGSIVYLPFEMTQLLCGMAGSVKRTNAIHIKFKPNIKLQDGCDKVASLWQNFRQERADEEQAYLLDTVTVQNWRAYRRASIAPMENEQIEMTVMFCFVAVVVVFIVFVVFYMIISHKSKDIGILKSIGVSNIDIIGLFSGFAFLVGLLGSCLGLFTGLLFLKNMNRIEDWLFERFSWQLFDRTIYAIGDLPSKASPKLLGIIALSAIIACLAGALVPSWQAARQKPVETLQVNQL
jgi:ABC-type lipoprotein release transport system permease subunit